MKESIAHILTSAANGGLESYVASLAHEQYRAGYRVIAIARPQTPFWNALQNTGIKLYSLQRGGYVSLVNILRTRSILEKEKVDLLHVHSGKDVWLGAESAIYSNRAVMYSVYMNIAPKHDALHRMIYKRISAFGSSSEAVNRDIIRYFNAKSETVFPLKYGRKAPTAEQIAALRAEGRRRLCLSDDELFALSLCRIDKQKGVEELARAIKIVHESGIEGIRFGIAGNPTQSGATSDGVPIYEEDALALKNWLDLFIHENVPKNRCVILPHQYDYTPILAAADIFVLPSYGEMYSLAVIEAMLCGVPVIGTDSGGTVEQIGKDENESNRRGLLIPPRDPQSIADALHFYILNPDIRRNHGNNAIKWARAHHSFKSALDQVDAAYNFAIKSKRGGK